MVTKQIGALVYNGFNSLDLVGPLEVFKTASELGPVDYQISLIGLHKGTYRSEGFLDIAVHDTVDSVKNLDLLILPGGEGARNTDIQSEHLSFLNRILTSSTKVASVCTGAYLLAKTGVLDGKKATTHWQYLEDFQTQFPKVETVDDILYIDHGAFATSAGVSSGIDLALKLIEQDAGQELAVKVARFLVVHYQRGGNQAQFSEPLHFQAKCGPEFSELTSWILQNLSEDLSVTKLAFHMNMSPRTFHRKFTEKIGETPAKFIELLRLDYARHLLVENNWSVQTIAISCGYTNTDVFRRAFHRRFNTSAMSYRAQFS